MKFHKGRPPHVGWWLCSSDLWRWWDGENWSFGAKAGCTESTLIAVCRSVSTYKDHYWCDFWPENALVPRLSTNSEVKKNPNGNRRVTRHIVVKWNEWGGTDSIVGSYENHKIAQAHADRLPTAYVETIRFRSPE